MKANTPVLHPPSLSGLLLVDKPCGLSSTTVTARVKSALRRLLQKAPKVGHMGTLDPFARGLLPIAIGSTTRLLPFTTHHPKSYRFTIAWGSETATGDPQGPPTETSDHRPSIAAIEGVLPAFRGDILQTPPLFSALHVNGMRAYDLARKGVPFTLPPRPQTIFSIVLVDATDQDATFDVSCNSGTYVRSLGQDIARALDTRGHLSHLRRTAIGPWQLTHATPLDSFLEITHTGADLRSLLIRPREVLDDIPALEVTDEEKQRLLKGLPLLNKGGLLGPVIACVQGDTLIALVRAEEEVLAPFRVLSETE